MSSLPDSAPPPPFLEYPELPPGVPPPARQPTWRPWMAFAALAAGIVAAILGATLIGAIGSAFGADFSDPPAAVTLLATVVQDVCLVGSALVFARMAGAVRPRDFGLRATAIWRALGWMAVAFVAFYVFTIIWVSIVGADTNDDKVVQDLGVDESTVALFCAAALVTVLAPIAEETFFRGFFFGALRNWRGVLPAALITGLVFGGVHAGSADVAYLLPLAFFGFALCLLRERTGSLYPCMALHCLNNSLAFGVTQDWTWQIPVLLLAALAAIAILGRFVLRLWPAVRVR